MNFGRKPFWCVAIAAMVACAMLAMSGTILAQGSKKMGPDPERVKAIAAMLRDEPGTFGRPCSDREAWDVLAKLPAMRDYLKGRERLLTVTIPPMTEATYMAEVKRWCQADCHALLGKRNGRVKQLVIAECLENKGRFIPKLEELLISLFADKTWVSPLRKQMAIDNWNGKSNNIDLTKAMLAWDVALADYLVGDRLRPEIRQQLRANLERRMFAPFRRMMRGEQKPDWWLAVTNNWNAVCLGSVVGAALTVLESKEDRAFFAASAEKYSKSFLKGFPSDGYCTEGLSYYNYGFSHYIALSEAIWQASEGKLDLFDVPNIRNIAMFGARIEIQNGVYPSIADCAPGSRPSPTIMNYTSRKLGLGLKRWEFDGVPSVSSGAFYLSLMNIFPNSATLHPAKVTASSALGDTSYFDDAGILICRPAKGAKMRMGVCLKGGHNGEHHNHNDVGSFTVVVGAEAPVSDVGAEVYSSRTFSAGRYESDALNSFGHSVPLVAGVMQSKGRKAAAKVLRAEFTDVTDTFVLDLKACYDVPDLEKMVRTFVYSREGEGSLTVTDEVVFEAPQKFETALITLGDCQAAGPDRVMLYDRESAVLATAESDAGAPEIRVETLTADLRVPAKAKRVAVALKSPVKAARVTVRIVPTKHSEADDGRNVRNGGFERGDRDWKHGRKSMCEVTTEKSASGKKSLKVVDTQTGGGSSWLSMRVPVKPGGTYELRGMVYPVSGSSAALGVYVRFYDRAGAHVKRVREEIAKSRALVGGNAKQWEPFSKRFAVTDETHYARIWIHSMTASKVTAYLDDLDIVAAGD